MGDSQVLVEPRQQDVRDELNRLLESPPFRSSKRCRDFLRHIVEQTLSGQRGSLKERSIGIDLFSLPLDFDTSQRTIVRVTASETRKKLALYYHSEVGTLHAVRIDLPPGAYNAEFTWKEEPQAKPLEEPLFVPELRRISRRWLVATGGTVGLLAAVGLMWSWRRSGSSGTRQRSAAVPDPAPAVGTLPPGNIRIAIGAANPYIDRNGQSWGADRLFSGGSVRTRPSERIMRTLDPDLYRRLRTGDFRYDILLPRGSYELHLHFAETGLSDFISAESSGEGQRVFRVSANGKTLLDFFDVVADADGANVADERVFRNISPADDGFLHLAFSPLRGSAMASGIELRAVNPGKVLPLRIRSGWPSSWQDAAGGQWRCDSYFLGGNALVRRSNPAQGSEQATPDDALYASERWGHFSYALPVADGRYRVTLKFCEGHHGPRNTGVGGVGSRLFDVHCNGLALLKDFDIMREAGGEGRPLDRVFPKIRPNAQGKIVLSFVPNMGMACVNGIEVVDEVG
jgi:hypothetical protein